MIYYNNIFTNRPKNKEEAIYNIMYRWKITYKDALELICNFEIRQTKKFNNLIKETALWKLITIKKSC